MLSNFNIFARDNLRSILLFITLGVAVSTTTTARAADTMREAAIRQSALAGSGDAVKAPAQSAPAMSQPVSAGDSVPDDIEPVEAGSDEIRTVRPANLDLASRHPEADPTAAANLASLKRAPAESTVTPTDKEGAGTQCTSKPDVAVLTTPEPGKDVETNPVMDDDPAIVDATPLKPVLRPVPPKVVTIPEKAKPELFVIVLVGDTGLNAHSQPVRENKALRQGRGFDWAWTTKYIASQIDGHINMANIETVVTTRNNMSRSLKTFNFRMHANGARHLVDTGFNVFSLANNHAADYGREGVRDTLLHSERLRIAGLRAYAGLGLNRDEAIQSQTFSVGPARFGFASMGIGARQPGIARAGKDKPGQVNIYGEKDFNDVIDNLVGAPADYRILSMHFGVERDVRPLPGQVAKWRDEVQIGRGIDLIVGHHSHVAQGVQMTAGKLIFYGLGNFLHMGMQDMGKFNACRDYGLLARVFVVRQPDGRMQAEAVQVVPLTDMHLQAKPRTGKAGGRRIDILNMLAESLDDDPAGSRGVRFAKQIDGSGLYCRPGAEKGPGRLGPLCESYTPAPALTLSERRRLRRMCSFEPRTATRTSRGKRRRASRKKRKIWKGHGAFVQR